MAANALEAAAASLGFPQDYSFIGQRVSVRSHLEGETAGF